MNLCRAWFVQLKKEFILYIQPSGYKSDFFIAVSLSFLSGHLQVLMQGKKKVGDGAVDFLLQVISVVFISF